MLYVKHLYFYDKPAHFKRFHLKYVGTRKKFQYMRIQM